MQSSTGVGEWRGAGFSASHRAWCCAGDALPSAIQGEAHASWGTRSFPWWWPAPSPLPSPTLSGPSPGFPLLWLSTPQPLVYCYPALGAPLPRLLGYLHTPNPSLLPGTDLQSLSQRPESPHPSFSGCGICTSGSDDLCFSVLRSAAALSSASWRTLQLG